MNEQRFPTPGPIRLEVRIPAGDISITAVDATEATVTLEGAPKLVEATTVELVGDRLRVDQRRKSFSWFGHLDQTLHVSARVPRGSQVELVTASADARLDGVLGGLSTKSASGDVVVTGELEGSAGIQTVSGDVRLPRVAGDVTGQSVSGNLTADAVDGSVSMKTVSGDLRIGSVHEGRVNVQSVSGDVELGVAAGTSVDLDANTASGDLSSEVPLTDTPSQEPGPSLVIRGNTVSGDFRVRRAV